MTKILEISNDPKASPADLNKVISLDPVLMGKVLKLINSAYYGLNQEITSLARAIIMLGINTVKNLALSTAVLGSFGNPKHFQALNMEGFWRHSLCVGVTAKLVAKYRKIPPKHLEEYFIAGVLHDIGKIPLNNKFEEEYVQAMGKSDIDHSPLYQAEKAVMDYNHMEAGHLVLKSWRIGDDIMDTVLYHHTPSAYGGKHIDLVYTIAAANYYANITEIGFSGDRYPEKVSTEVFDYLNISLDFLDDIEDQVQQAIEKAQVFLNVASS